MDAAERMLIEWEITTLTNRFMFHLDRNEFDSMTELFTADGVFHRLGEVHRGHAEIRQVMRERAPMTTRHLLTNFVFTDVRRESARAVVSSMVHRGPARDEDGGPVVYSNTQGRLSEFDNHYVRTAEGWRITSLIAHPVLIPEVWV